jgi:photosynthetic reaction center cytochrome c subunit
MSKTFLRVITAVVLCIVVLPAWPVQSQSSQPGPKTAGQTYKNVQVLRGIPDSKLLDTMTFVSASLGVECAFCHVENAYEKDDKKSKQTARQMMRMQMAINQENFQGKNAVTCFSCHGGNNDPVAIPTIAGEAAIPDRNEAAVKNDLPTSDEVVNKYAQSLGGAEALRKVTSLVEKGTIGKRATPIEYFAKWPDKKMSIVRAPNGQESTTSFDGKTGWVKGPGTPAHELDPGNIEILRLDATFNLALQMKQVFSQFIVRPPEKIGQRGVMVLDALKPGQSRVRFYFDSQAGLLLRLVRYLDTPLGQLPTQIDYDDYRDSGGIKVPYRWTVTRAGSNGFTVQIQQVEQNVSLDDRRFVAPPAEQK